VGRAQVINENLPFPQAFGRQDPSMSPSYDFRGWAPRILLCLATAAVISATAYLCAWFEYGGYPYFQIGQEMTRYELEEIRKEVERYRETSGRLPTNLAELDVVKDRKVRLDDRGRPVDYWDRPFHYEVDDGSYALYSLGRDGRVGGFGLDADLHAGKRDRATELPTLWQFTTQLNTEGIQLSCLLAGILAFPLCLLGVRRGEADRLSPVRVVFVHGLTAFFAVLTAVVISVVHLPSGH
jgi:hypothetical protein